ncbi:MAG: glyoxylase-like metal-dependent hydrolase (beta-lactamase superfamily II) [Halieaceae bacterium]|jgi:glyoxylase-like metal-dependent hydrolase (beta-lactamase superfamily II)
MASSELRYPFSDPPEPGCVTQVAPGVLWLRMALPMALDHINLYMIETAEGWWIIDTGMKVGDTKERWDTIFERHLGGKPVIAVLCTHMHPDHCGQAGWLCERWRVPLYMTQAEYLSARNFSKLTSDDLTWTSEEFYQRAGRPDYSLEKMKESYFGFGNIVEPLPSAYRRLVDGQMLAIGDQRWRVIIGSGHSPEHACLYSDSLNVLIAGDQVIPRITSNVSVVAMEPEANPLRQWMDSHYKFLDQLPADALVLPAHNTPFYGLHNRLRTLLNHHEDHLLALEEACVEPSTAWDLLPVLFKRKLEESQQGLALGECIAHLHLLMYRGQMHRELDSSGCYLYTSIDETLSVRARPGTHVALDGPMEV